MSEWFVGGWLCGGCGWVVVWCECGDEGSSTPAAVMLNCCPYQMACYDALEVNQNLGFDEFCYWANQVSCLTGQLTSHPSTALRPFTALTRSIHSTCSHILPTHSLYSQHSTTACTVAHPLKPSTHSDHPLTHSTHSTHSDQPLTSACRWQGSVSTLDHNAGAGLLSVVRPRAISAALSPAVVKAAVEVRTGLIMPYPMCHIPAASATYTAATYPALCPVEH